MMYFHVPAQVALLFAWALVAICLVWQTTLWLSVDEYYPSTGGRAANVTGFVCLVLQASTLNVLFAWFCATLACR